MDDRTSQQQTAAPAYRLPLAITFASSVATASGQSMIFPVLPDMAAGMQVGLSEIGLAMVAFTSPSIVLAPVFGIVGDRHSRKWALVLGLMLYGLAGSACGLAPSFEWLLLLRTLQGIGFAAVTPQTLTLISDLMSEEREIHGQGWKVVIDRIAMILAPIAGGMLAAFSWRYAFAPFMLSVPLALAAWFWMPETTRRGSETLRQYLKLNFVAMREPRLRTAFATGFIRFFTDYGLFTYFSLFLALRYGAIAATAGWLVAVSSMGSIVTAINVGFLHKLMSPERFLVVAFAVGAAALAVLPLHVPIWAIGVAVFVFGMANGVLSPLQKSLLTRNTQPTMRGGVIAVDRVIQQMAKSIAPAIMGLLLLVAEVEAVFWSLAVFCVAGAAYMARADYRRRRIP